MNKQLPIQQEKAKQLHQLHHSDKLLVLPNVWDVLSARLLEDMQYPAIATASAAIAYTNGYNDGEKIPFSHLLSILKKITSSVNLPVTADIESGYADNSKQLQENIKQLLEAGIVGINFEDSNHAAHTLNSIAVQCKRIELIRKAANEIGISLFINARADVLLYDKEFPTPELKIKELVKRGLAYKEAGADCFFPIALRNKEDIQELVIQLKMPVNILTLPGIPGLQTLKEMGVTRVSLGPAFLKIAIKAMKELAGELKEYNGLETITENEITSDYLKTLINN